MGEVSPCTNLSRWQRVKKTRRYARLKLFLKRLTGKELWLRPEVERNLKVYAGEWAICPDVLGERALVYSAGIGDTVSFEMSIIRDFGAEVHAFDPTPETARWIGKLELPDRLHFHPWAMAASDGERMFYPRVKRSGAKSDSMYTLSASDGSRPDGIPVVTKDLDSIMDTLGHDDVDLLRMDIEGAEFEVLDALLATSVRPRQVLVEFHHRFAGIGKDKAADILSRLRAEGYRIMFISSTGREISFIRD